MFTVFYAFPWQLCFSTSYANLMTETETLYFVYICHVSKVRVRRRERRKKKKKACPARVAEAGQENIETVHEPKPIQAVNTLWGQGRRAMQDLHSPPTQLFEGVYATKVSMKYPKHSCCLIKDERCARTIHARVITTLALLVRQCQPHEGTLRMFTNRRMINV